MLEYKILSEFDDSEEWFYLAEIDVSNSPATKRQISPYFLKQSELVAWRINFINASREAIGKDPENGAFYD